MSRSRDPYKSIHFQLRPYLKWLDIFMSEHDLYPSGGSFIGLSGGKDSIFLTYLLSLLFPLKGLKRPSILYFDHGTYERDKSALKTVQDFCHQLKLQLIIGKNTQKVLDKNFEHEAREQRYQFFYKQLKKDDLLYLAHQIDDSLEWSLLQKFRSSNPQSSLGIPLVKGPIRRPLHCFSREQIDAFFIWAKLPFWEDPSNDSLNFERNYIRHTWLKPLKEKHPQYIKHFSKQGNFWAKKLGLYQGPLSPVPLFFEDPFGNLSLWSLKGDGSFLGRQEEIKKVLNLLSQKGRGAWADQIDKLIEGQKSGKVGPYAFSGGIKALAFSGMLFFYTADTLKALRDYYDSTSQIPVSFFINDPLLKGRIPYFVFSEKPLLGMESLKSLPSEFSFFLDYAKGQGLWLRPTSSVLLKNKLRKELDGFIFLKE